jgi:transcriptional regulator with XRE-family HTH domain
MAAHANPKNLAKHGWFAARLRRLMKEQGLRNRDLAERLGSNLTTAQTNVSSWVRAISTPGPRYREKLAKALGVTEEALYAPDEPSKVVALVPRPPSRPPSRALTVVNGQDHDDVFNVIVKQGVADLHLRVQVPVTELDRAIFGLRQLGLVR